VRKLPPHSSEETHAIRLLRSAIASGDWDLARASAELLAREQAPPSAADLKALVEVLAELLKAARAGRAHLADSLARVTAASRFHGAGDPLQPGDRQNLVDSTDF
jgi:hypothetical protein